MSEEGCLTIIVIFGFIVLVALGVGADYLTCVSKYSAFEPKWGVVSGCRLNINGKLIPAESYYVKEDIK